jgi:Peptidase S80 family
MADKNNVTISPTGSEGWIKHLAHFFGSDIPTPVTHRFTDPITNEQVKSNTSFPEKSVIGSAVVKALGQVDRKGNSYAKILFDSPHLFNSGVDITPDKDGIYRLNVGSFGIENVTGNTYVIDRPLGVGSFNIGTPLTRRRILVGERPTNKMYTELFHPVGRV